MKNESHNGFWQYDLVAKLLHWIVAALLITLFIIGWYMMSIVKEPRADWYFTLHKSLGLTAAMLILFRLTWRISHPPHALPLTVPSWQVIASRIVHWSLYICMILMPLAGFLGASFDNAVFFYGLTLPNWVHKNKSLTTFFLTTHGYIAWVLLSLIILHILAAFKHLLLHKDNVFKRMWF